MRTEYSAGSTSPPVWIVVLNYNGKEHLEIGLPSLLATDYEAFNVLVVDNASTDGSVDYVRRQFPTVTVLASPVNEGWSGGNNLGIRHACRAGARYVVLANNDIRVDPRWIRMAVGIAENDARIGIVGFRLLEPRGGDPDAGFSNAVREWQVIDVQDTEKMVNGTAMFVRASVFEHVGPIDEGFFAYAEDDDFERRVRQGGYRILATNIPVWHRGQGSFGKIPLRAGVLQIRNNLRLSLKHDGIGGNLYQLARHFIKGCVPFWPVDLTDPLAKRLHPSNVVVNFGIFLYAIVWNARHLVATRRQRRIDQRRAADARRQWTRPGLNAGGGESAA
ncbi:MAG: glycosyltransferase family 2 protein [Verrucomicrobia bacterium]|nr:glycosyltransferase family 2 protein [Verrucomicrobiota bacterium]